MSNKKLLKGANSKGQLAKAVMYYARALEHYANEAHWAVKGEDIVWVGDDDPTYAAALSLGKRKVDPNYGKKSGDSKLLGAADKTIPSPELP